MNWIRQSSLYVYLTIGTLLFLVFYSYFQFSEFKKFTQYVEHTYKVINSTERLKGSMEKLIALRRGYILEQTPEIKDLILTESKNLTALTDTLALQIKDNKVQTTNLAQLRELINLSQASLDSWFENSKSGMPMDSMIADIREVSPALEKAFTKLNRMREIEDNLLKIRASLQNETGRTVPFMLLITGLTTILMLIYAFYLISIDLKARLSAKVVLEKNVQDLHLANTELERFAFIASHNLKEPLRKSQTFISRMLESIPASDAHSQGLQKVNSSLGRLQEMLDDLMIYTRLLQHNETKELLDLNKIVKAVSGEFSQEIDNHGVSIHISMLPMVNGYPRQVMLVFRHLFSNTLKYRKEGTTPIITIAAAFNDDSGLQVITFSDNGIGFDTKYNQKIFEVFGRLHTKDEYDGTGIGLAICRRAMFNHDGFIIADATTGAGSTFSLYFPY